MWERGDMSAERILYCASARLLQAEILLSGYGFVGCTAPEAPPSSPVVLDS